MNKKFLAMLLTLAMVLSLAACGSKKEETPAETPAETPVETRTLAVAAITSATSTHGIATQYMADGLREASNGSLDMQLYNDSTLGGQVEYIEGCSMGTVDMCIAGTAALEDFYSKYAVYGIPFLWRDEEHIMNFFHGEMGQKLNEEFLEATGMRILAFYYCGGRHVWTNNKPLRTLEDFKGVALRVPEVSVYIDSFNALGCNATVVPLADVYTGMQTGLVDGFELPISGTCSVSLHEQSKYCTLTNHMADCAVLIINEGVFQSLTEEQQALMLEWSDKLNEKHVEVFAEEYAKYEQQALDAGVEFIEVSAEERVKIADALQGVISALEDGVFEPGYLDAIRDM